MQGFRFGASAPARTFADEMAVPPSFRHGVCAVPTRRTPDPGVRAPRTRRDPA